MTGICTGGGGSAGGYGTIFKITTTGTLSTLHSFDSTDGAGPAGLVQATDGNFYGTTNSGGLSNGNCLYGNILGTCGTVFKMTPTGTLTTLHGFNYTDGGNSGAALVQGSDGNIYRTTSDGGSVGSGTVFKITPTGTLTTVHNFNTRNGDDAFPGGTGPAHQRDLLRVDSSWRQSFVPFLPRYLWHALQSVCSLNADGKQEQEARRASRLRGGRSAGGLGELLQCLSEDVAFLMHHFASCIGLAGIKIDRFVADRADDLRLQRMCHAANSLTCLGRMRRRCCAT